MQRFIRTLALICLALTMSAISFAQKTKSASVNDYLGRWDLTLNAPDRYPSWLELTEKDGQLHAEFVGRWGNARPLPKAELNGNKLTFVSPKDEEGSDRDLVFEGTLSGGKLSGTVNAPDGRSIWNWTGVRAPALQRTEEPKWGKPIQLFNGKDLTGWTMSVPHPEESSDILRKPFWKVVDGVLVSPGHGSEIINNQKFNDFKLHIEFNCGENSNSGVYLRGRYEVQIETNSVQEPPSHHTGGVYGFIAPQPELPRTADKWQSYDITLVGRNITVVQNGTTIIDHQEIPGITGGALDSNEELPGPIYLQGSEDGHVMFRNIVLTPAKD